MGNEISTISGGAVTVGAAVLAGATLGQVQGINDVVTNSAAFTAEKAKKTVVRHIGEATVMATATVGAGLASVATLGRVQALNDAALSCANQTALASYSAGAEVASIADGVTNSMPVVGHVKGAVLYAVGSSERGERAMKGATRSVGVVSGGISGFIAGGPPGAVAGGMAGGAVMDGLMTGADSALHRDLRPHGQVACWHQVANAKTSQELVRGIVGTVTLPMVDGLAGLGAGAGSDGAGANANAQVFTSSVFDAGLDGSFEPEHYEDMPSEELDDSDLLGAAVVVGSVGVAAGASVDTVRGKDIPITAEYLDALAVKATHADAAWTNHTPASIQGVVVLERGKRSFHANPNFAPPLMPGADGPGVVLEVRHGDLPSTAEARSA